MGNPLYNLFTKYAILFSTLLAWFCGHSQTNNFPKNSMLMKTIDTSAIYRWTSVGDKPLISKDGQYFIYKVSENYQSKDVLVIESITGNWWIRMQASKAIDFTSDSKMAVCLKSTDSLCLITLGSSKTEYFSNVSSYKLFTQLNEEWIAMLLNSTEKRLVLCNLKTGVRKLFDDVNEFLLSKDGSTLIVKKISKSSDKTFQTLWWINLIKGTNKLIWNGANATNLVLDDRNTQLAFLVPKNEVSESEYSIWYYKVDTDTATQLINNNSKDLDTSITLDRVKNFSKDGYRLFFSLKEKEFVKQNPNAIKVDIWSYTDPKLQFQQLEEWQFYGPKRFLAVVDLSNNHILQLEDKKSERIIAIAESDTIMLLMDREGDYSEWNWNKTSKTNYFLISTKTGIRKEINISNLRPSPNGKYLLGADEERKDLYTYEVSTGRIRNITNSLPIPVGDPDYDQPYMTKSRPLIDALWLYNDDKLLVYDKYDIWLIDPKGRKASINITNSYGRMHRIKFRLAGDFCKQEIEENNTAILVAFDEVSKNNGFFIKDISLIGDPVILSMRPYLYYYPDKHLGFKPLKIKDNGTYLIQRQSATHSPNYFWTKDFKNFNALSEIYPESNYRWLTSQLNAFKTLDGHKEQCIIYKPVDFDQHKKYPVIIHYYDRKSDELNLYPKPGDGYGPLDIAWFVSHGYIVCTPDIHYKIGNPGKSAYNSIMGVRNFISSLPWVDINHLGVQGHSFGGYETNYIVTHTNKFAAACSSSGLSDLISSYLGFLTNHSNHDWYENRIFRIGATLWNRPDLYIKNSPIFDLNKVSTPLLTVANKSDRNVYFNQGVELFLALRRLGKTIWMLQYDNGDHGVHKFEDKMDYIIRMTQFFDHYLKDTPCPIWMLDGIPAKRKGIDNGLQLDTTGRTPSAGLLLKKH